MIFYIVIGTLVSSVLTVQLPDYITICSQSDPNLTSCLLKNAQKVLKIIETEGDPKYEIADLSPIKFSRLKLQASPTLKIDMTNVEISGFPNIIFKDIHLKDNKLILKSSLDKAILLADYNIIGKILFLPIQGQGKINLTFVDNDLVYTAQLSQETISNNIHYKVSQDDTDFQLHRLYYDLTNLFNGDPKLGPEMNKFLNDNWRDVYSEIGITVRNIISKIFKRFINGYLSKIPINQLFDK